MTVKYKWLPR